MMLNLREEIVRSQANLYIPPIAILHAIDSFTKFKEMNLTSRDNYILRKNIVIIFNLIKNYRTVIFLKFKSIVRDDMFNRVINKGLTTLKTFFDFLGNINYSNVEEYTPRYRNSMNFYAKNISPLPEPKNTTPEITDTSKALETIVLLRNLSLFLTSKLQKF